MEKRVYVPFEASHPGCLIKDELDYRGISQKEFAQDIGMQTTMLNEIIKGKRGITAEIALSLEKGLGISADSWMRHQASYELDCVRIQERSIQKTKQIEIWGLIKQFVPVNIFTKLGLLSNSLADNIAKIWDIYGVGNIDELIESYSKHLNSAYYKKSDKLKADQTNIFGWSKLAQWQAKKETVSAFNLSNKNQLIEELKATFLTNDNTQERVKQILSKYGIKFFVLEKFKQVPIDGYSFWSDNNPTIAITLRKKTLDNFAFTLMHELGHIIEHLQSDRNSEFIDIEQPKKHLSQKEIEANNFARNAFLDEMSWKEFVSNNTDFLYNSTEQEIINLAKLHQIHPSIVLGRYCYETNNYKIKTGIDREIR